MIIAAVIESINPRTKTCVVTLPDLQSAADTDPVTREAVMLETPGIANSYKVGDLVWVGFIRGLKKYPIVIGRILTTDANYSNLGRAAVFDSLEISQTAQLPADITFLQTEASYNSLLKIINKNKEALLQVGECKQALLDQKQTIDTQKISLDEHKLNIDLLTRKCEELAESISNLPESTNSPTVANLVVQSFSNLAEITAFEGLEVYILDDKKSYRFLDGRWTAEKLVDTLGSVLTVQKKYYHNSSQDFLTDFEDGQVLLVQNTMDIDYRPNMAIEIFPTTFNSKPITPGTENLLEFTNWQQFEDTKQIPGNWRVKTTLGNCILAQKHPPVLDKTELPSSIMLSNGVAYSLNKQENGKQRALSWYREPSKTNPNLYEMRSIFSSDLMFFDKNMTLIKDSTKDTIYYIGYQDEFNNIKILQDAIDDMPADNVHKYRLAILNLATADMTNSVIINANKDPCRFFCHTFASGAGNSMFTSYCSERYPFGLEAILLSDAFYLKYPEKGTPQKRGYSEIPQHFCKTAEYLTTIYLPSEAGIIGDRAFKEAGQQVPEAVSIYNLENTHISVFGMEAFLNVRFANNQLRLPKIPLDKTLIGPADANGNRPELSDTNTIYFGEHALGYRANTNPGLKTLFVNSPVDFDHKENGGELHNGCFCTGKGITAAYKGLNTYMYELVYTKNAEDTTTCLRASSVQAFLRVSTGQSVDITNALDQFITAKRNNPALANFDYQENDWNLTFIDYDLNPIELGTQDTPTIIYNYKESI